MSPHSHGPQPPKPPPERLETARQRIAAVLSNLADDEYLTPSEISHQASVSMRDVARHLEHIRLSAKAGGEVLQVRPARCLECGFVFAKRERLTRPGACPVCKGQRITEPGFRLSI